MKKVISKDGTTIAYQAEGTGPALILIDGALSTASFGSMSKLSRLLSSHFTVVCYDRRGRGESTDHPVYIAEKEVEDLEALIKEVNAPVYLFGISSGAILTLFAASKNLPIEKIVMYEPPFQAGGDKNAEDYSRKIKAILKTGDRSGAVKYFLRQAVKVPTFIVTIMSLLPVWKNVKTLVTSLPHDLDLAHSFNLEAVKSATVSVPSLFVYGSKCKEDMRNSVLLAAGNVPGSQVKVLKGQTHNVSDKAIAPELISFFTT